MTAAAPVPVLLITGFLGSGKTTLLAHLLADPKLGETAVLVNEIGEVAIDHHLLRRVDERTVVLGNGCVCCTMREDLAVSVRDLLARRARGEVPPFARIVVETTGLAEPAPIVQTLLADPVLSGHARLEALVATADALNGPATLARHPEAVRQLAAADRIVLTKIDLASDEQLGHAAAAVRGLNPTVPVLRAARGQLELEQLRGGRGRRDPRGGGGAAGAGAEVGPHAHLEGVDAFALVFDRPLDWTAFGVWLTMLLARHGTAILRVKGLIDTGGEGPVVLDAVQHAVHPPRHLPAWPDEDESSRIVFITRGPAREAIADSLAAFAGHEPALSAL
jgi:G3E family GTPase